jgi:putative membrane protein
MPERAVSYRLYRFLYGIMQFLLAWQDVGMKLVLRILAVAAALGVAHLVISGIELRGGSDWSKAGTLIVVALIFGIVNAVIKPVVKTVGCVFYVLTLGLIGLVVNGLLLWLCSYVAGELSLPFHITGFWPAFWGAIIVGVVGWVLTLLLDGTRKAARIGGSARHSVSGSHRA